MALGRWVKGLAQDRPALVNAVLGLLVFAYWLLCRSHPKQNIALILDKAATRGEIVTLHLGVAALAAMTAGFAGVVVVFGLTADAERFRQLRREGDHRLRATWVSVVSSSFLSAFVAVGAATAALANWVQPSVWATLVAVFLLAHAAVRLLWMLTALARVKHGDDQDSSSQEMTVAEIERRTATLGPGRPESGDAA
ncbi:MAG: hypothetical protein JWO67_6400 [Streptosporangiaceae bacterium]|nr:hypothetical protein [Streptosporangiaceae bacterium]